MRRFVVVPLLSALLAPLLCGAPVRAADAIPAIPASQCYDAHEAGQLHRKRGELHQARVSFATCGAPSCPSIVQRDCVTWAAELSREQPSVVLAVVGPDGRDVGSARATLDRAPAALDGHAVELDPGEHRLHVEAPGAPPVDQRFTLREGERARRIKVVVGEEPAPRRTSPEAATWILGGVGVVSLASFGTFAVMGKSRENELARTCDARCTDDEVASVRRSYVAADVSLGIAVLAAGAAIVTWVLAPKTTRTARGPELFTF